MPALRSGLCFKIPSSTETSKDETMPVVVTGIFLMSQLLENGRLYEQIKLVDSRGNEIDGANPVGSAVDAAQRARVAQPLTIFESVLRFSKRVLLWDESVANGASTNYVEAMSGLELILPTTANASALRQSRRYLPLEAGKSNRFDLAFSMAPPQDGLIQEVGVFDESDGFFFRKSNDQRSLVIRSSVTGSVVETVINQSDWNIDRLDGTGDSKLELDAQKIQVLVIDTAYVGVGGIRFGFINGNRTIYVHQYKVTNQNTIPEVITATLPIRYHIRSTKTLSQSAKLMQYFSTAVTEGGVRTAGFRYPAKVTTSLTTIGTTETLIAAIRKKSTRLKNIVFPASIGAVTDANAPAKWKVYYNPTITGGTWTDAPNNRGNVEVNLTGTLSGGTVIASGYVAGQSQTGYATEDGILASLGNSIAGASDVLALTIQGSKANVAVDGNLDWYELY